LAFLGVDSRKAKTIKRRLTPRDHPRGEVISWSHLSGRLPR
jgi:hypothetical protein